MRLLSVMKPRLDLMSDARSVIVVSSVCSQRSNPYDMNLILKSYQGVTRLTAPLEADLDR